MHMPRWMPRLHDCTSRTSLNFINDLFPIVMSDQPKAISSLFVIFVGHVVYFSYISCHYKSIIIVALFLLDLLGLILKFQIAPILLGRL
jgi:hypothetical protein